MARNPYLLPNFHTWTEKNRSLNQYHNNYAIPSQLEYNGSGVYNSTIVLKSNKTTDFYPLSPTLPYYVHCPRLQYNFAANNCLISCRHEDTDLLVSSTANKITGLSINENRVDTSVDTSITVTKAHTYSSAKSVSYGPFRYCTQNVFDLYVAPEEDFHPVFDLRLYASKESESQQIETTSRNKISFYNFTTEDSDSDNLNVGLDLIQELEAEKVGSSVDSVFNYCDRNETLENQLLVSYCNDLMQLFDLKTNQIIRKFEDYFQQKPNKQIGLSWSQLNPSLFFYGEHQKILYCDARTHKPVMNLFTKSKNNKNLYEWEMFYQFLPTKLNEYQLFLATDYHILVTDCRYPKRNLIQLNHMIPKQIIRSLKSLVIESEDRDMCELLVSSNLVESCLMSFKKIADLIPLSSLHLPLHLSNPKDIDKQFENCFYRGIQLMDCPNKTGFSLALLTNFGDIFVQDFYWDSVGERNAKEGEEKERCFSAGVGSSDLELDSKVGDYMNEIDHFLNRLSVEKSIETNNMRECLNCLMNRVCKVVDNECQCRHLTDFSRKLFTPSDESDVEMAEDMSMNEVVVKYCGSEVLQNSQTIQNREKLHKNTDIYSKKVFEFWGVFEDLTKAQESLDPIITEDGAGT